MFDVIYFVYSGPKEIVDFEWEVESKYYKYIYDIYICMYLCVLHTDTQKHTHPHPHMDRWMGGWIAS